MAINPQKFGKPDQMKWSSDDQYSSQVKSYICSFCSKGFSTAQALGGHMNIHRRDRARLRQAADENSLPFDITTNPIDHEPQGLEEKILFRLESGEEKSCSPKKPCSLSVEDDNRGKAITKELNQLPMFLKRSSARDDRMETDCTGTNYEEKKMQLSHASQQTAEILDLELRLGPEPQETSTASTREFF